MFAWDLINEPAWAISGPNLNGGEDFTPQSNLESVTHQQMLTFVNELAAVFKANGNALVSVGGAGMKWGSAWKTANVDVYQLHYYDGLYANYPYTANTLAAAGLTDKPVVMGEFLSEGLAAVPSKGLPARSYDQLGNDLWANGYAGALGWAFNGVSTKAFADQHPCETVY